MALTKNDSDSRQNKQRNGGVSANGKDCGEIKRGDDDGIKRRGDMTYGDRKLTRNKTRSGMRRRGDWPSSAWRIDGRVIPKW